MLLVEQRISGEEVVSNQKSFNIDDFIWPHTRKRRFRRRVNKRTIESVEQEVERLLEQDALAQDDKYGTSLRHQLHFIDVLENVNPDLSDSEFIEQDNGLEGQTPGGHSEPGDAGTPGGGDGDESDEDGEDGEADGDIDEELAAELDRELEGEDEDEDDEDESEDEG